MLLREFIAWWAEQMGSFVPRRWLPPETPADALVLDIDTASSSILVRERLRRHETERLEFAATAGIEPLRPMLRGRAGRTIVIRPPRAALLERDLSLPLAAAPDLPRVLAYEMDRFMPFRADQVFSTHRVLTRNVAAGSLRVRLSVVPRDALLGLPLLLQQETRSPLLLEAHSRSGDLRTIPIAVPGSSGSVSVAGRMAVWGTLALAVAVLVAPFVRQSITLSDLNSRVATLRPEVNRAEALRTQIMKAAAAGSAIAQEQARISDPLQVLATLTQLLPDDTFLESLTMNNRVLTMQGQSSAAAQLIPLLSGNKLFQDPSFTAPVTRSQHGKDIFALRVKISSAQQP